MLRAAGYRLPLHFQSSPPLSRFLLLDTKLIDTYQVRTGLSQTHDPKNQQRQCSRGRATPVS